MNGENERELFRNILPRSRLGESHGNYDEFLKAIAPFESKTCKHYTLIMITERTRRRILLGLKKRGFGTGMYNSFGGKIEPGEDIDESARRELEEETGISLTPQKMSRCRRGILRFTFLDQDTTMVVHLFRVNVTSFPGTEDENTVAIDFDRIEGCEEIQPQWWDDWYEIPLDNMFADDSLWLTKVLLQPDEKYWMAGYFHFDRGGQDVNTILHHHISLRPRDPQDEGVRNE